MTYWAHISELPPEIRSILDLEAHRLDAEDRAVLVAIQTARLTQRVPTMCRALIQSDPTLSARTVFQAVALVTGISEPHIRRLYYRGMKAW